MFRSDDDNVQKQATTRATGAKKVAILGKSETAHEGHLADNFNVSDGEW
mgnify:CR=1 FL=1